MGTIKEYITKAVFTGFLAVALGQTVYAESGDLLWKFETQGAIWGDIKIRQNTAYFGSDDHHLYAVNIKTQQLRWKLLTGGIVRSAPAFKAGKVFFTSDDGYLYALNKNNGSLIWKLDIGDGDLVRNGPSYGPPWDFDWAKSSPTIKGGTLFVGSANGKLYAVDYHTGDIEWTFAAGDRLRGTPTVKGPLVYISSWDKHVYAINRHNGRQIWKYAAGDRFVSTPSVIDGKIIIGNRDAHIHALNAKTGELVWKYFYPSWSWVESSAIPGDEEGTFFIGSSDAKKLSKFDSNTGTEIWSAAITGWGWGTPALSDDTVYIGYTGADLYWQPIMRGFQAVDAESGEVLWSYEPAHVEEGYMHGGVHSRPAVKFGMVFVGDLDGTLYVFEE